MGLSSDPKGPGRRSSWRWSSYERRDSSASSRRATRFESYEDAVAHAAAAGRRGAVKIVFDLRKGKIRHGCAIGTEVPEGSMP